MSHRRGPGGQAAPRPRRRFRLPRASTTPGRLWLARAGLVIGCLAWGALATLMVIQHASAAHDVAAADESLSLDAQQIYQSLADQAVFASNAAAGSDAFTGLEAGVIVLALVMAIGCGWGLTRRLSEYR
jgi:hypothetical protein